MRVECWGMNGVPKLLICFVQPFQFKFVNWVDPKKLQKGGHNARTKCQSRDGANQRSVVASVSRLGKFRHFGSI